MRMSLPLSLFFILLSLLWASATAAAEEIKVFSVNGVKSVMSRLGPEFQAASGDRVQFTFATIGALQEKMAAGEIPDVLIAIAPAIAKAEEQGQLVPGSIAEVGRTGVGIAVKEGAAVPDVSTAQKLRLAVLAARSLAYSDPKSGAASGVAFAQVLEKLGIAEQAKGKTTLTTGSVGELIVQGKAELGAQQISELLPVKGISIRPLPTELQTVTIYRAAVLAQSKQPQRAAAFIRFITGPEAVRRFQEAGFGKY
jgi:molybdate transport system substrate-binding protein